MIFFTSIGVVGVIALAVFIIAGIVSVENDSIVISLATLVIAALTATYWFKIPLWAMIVGNPLILVGMVLGYVAAGGLYTTLYRWPMFIKRNKEKIKSSHTQWAMNRKGQNQDDSLNAYLDSDSYGFNAWNHKERLSTWISMWPFALLWTLAHRPAIWFGKMVYHSMGNMLQAVSRRTATKILEKD